MAKRKTTKKAGTRRTTSDGDYSGEGGGGTGTLTLVEDGDDAEADEAAAEPEPTEDDKARARLKLLDAIEEVHGKLVAAAREVNDAKELLKAAKGEHARWNLELLRLTGGAHGELPLFDPLEAAVLGEAELWRSVPLSDVLSGKDAQRLAENADLHTIGQLADWTDGKGKNHRPQELTEIDGIGPAAADRINEALDAYWAANPRPSPAPVGEGPEESEDELGE
jgi:hypothetical protein